MPDAHRLDGGIVDQRPHDAFHGVMAKGAHIIAIGLVAFHVGIGVGHTRHRSNSHKMVVLFLEDLGTVHNPRHSFGPR